MDKVDYIFNKMAQRSYITDIWSQNLDKATGLFAGRLHSRDKLTNLSRNEKRKALRAYRDFVKKPIKGKEWDFMHTDQKFSMNYYGGAREAGGRRGVSSFTGELDQRWFLPKRKKDLVINRTLSEINEAFSPLRKNEPGRYTNIDISKVREYLRSNLENAYKARRNRRAGKVGVGLTGVAGLLYAGKKYLTNKNKTND